MFQQLLWRNDRIDPIAKHKLIPAEVEETVFDDPCRRMLRGPRSEGQRTQYIYYLYRRTQAARYVLVVLLDIGKGVALPGNGTGYDPKGETVLRREMNYAKVSTTDR